MENFKYIKIHVLRHHFQIYNQHIRENHTRHGSVSPHIHYENTKTNKSMNKTLGKKRLDKTKATLIQIHETFKKRPFSK